jgi:phosphopantothenoylcysteine synthetase/decarboxylase
MPAGRRVLLVGGSPRVPVDAVRFLQARGTGATARALAERLATRGCAHDLLLSDATPGARTYDDRSDLDAALRAWIAGHPDGCVVLSAAINDWMVDRREIDHGGVRTVLTPDTKAPSAADALHLRLVPAPKVLDALAGWGLRGPVVGFKFEDRATVIASAQAQLARVGSALCVANSLCGQVQALVWPDRVEPCPDRPALLDRLAAAIAGL